MIMTTKANCDVLDIDPYMHAPYHIHRNLPKVSQPLGSDFVQIPNSRELSSNSSVDTEISSGLSSDGRVSPTIAPTVLSERVHTQTMKYSLTPCIPIPLSNLATGPEAY